MRLAPDEPARMEALERRAFALVQAGRFGLALAGADRTALLAESAGNRGDAKI